MPNDDYVAKVGAAAGSGSLPDLFAADIVYVPNWTSQGLFTDITDRIDGLPYADELAQGHIDAGTYEDKEYVLPFVLDLSVMFWNKDLYREAGLDPEQPPTTLEEFGEHAKAIRRWARTVCPARTSAGTAAAARSSRGSRRSGPAATRS